MLHAKIILKDGTELKQEGFHMVTSIMKAQLHCHEQRKPKYKPKSFHRSRHYTNRRKPQPNPALSLFTPEELTEARELMKSA